MVIVHALEKRILDSSAAAGMRWNPTTNVDRVGGGDSGHESQEAGLQDELIDGKPPVVK